MMAGSLSLLGPDGPEIDFSLVDLDGEPPYLSDPLPISVSNTGDTALAGFKIFDANETGHLELSVDQKDWSESLTLRSILMPGQSKSLFARAVFSAEDEEGISKIRLSVHAQSVPVEVIHMIPVDGR
jgi:hypothetical protein